MKIKLRKY
jgi:hypothetical protein